MCNIAGIIGKECIIHDAAGQRRPGEDIVILEIGKLKKQEERFNTACILANDGQTIDRYIIAAGWKEEDTDKIYPVDIETKKAEVKSILAATYLSRDNDQHEPSGTLLFELWKSQQDGTRENKKQSPGWVYEYINPEYTSGNEPRAKIRKAEKPDYLVFVLTLDEEAHCPFCSIMFEFSKVADRLKELARKNGWNLEDWNTIPANGSWNGRGVNLGNGQTGIKNCWHIPLREFECCKPKIVMWAVKNDDRFDAKGVPVVEQLTKRNGQTLNEAEKRLAQTRFEYLSDHQSNPYTRG